MPNLLLATKFFAPRIRDGLVLRPHLLKSLDRSLSLPLTIIAAPPGSGKTTLIAEWMNSLKNDPAAASICTGWVSLDKEDNVPARFWACLIAALRKSVQDVNPPAAEPSPFAEIQKLIETNPPPYQIIVTLLINEVAAASNPFILILDDYHFVIEPEISEGITYLVEHAPANLHLIISSRTEPPLPIGRWRSRSRLHMIRSHDLRFSLDETAAFFYKTMGVKLSQENVAKLEQRTEGWAAGLQLAALALQDQDESGLSRTIDSFSGRHHFILDYFTQEILQRQPEEVQHFLVRTSILERMCAELCACVVNDGLTPGKDRLSAAAAQSLLENLERTNLFIVPLDTERRWYRYHHLFKDLLQVRLKQVTGPAGEAELRRQAAVWHAQQGHHHEAVQQALNAADYELAAEFIENPAQLIRIWGSGEVSTILKWTQALPVEVIRRHPWLMLFQSRSLFYSGQTDEAEAVLDNIELEIQRQPASIPNITGLAVAVLSHRARYASVRGQVHLARERALQALDLLPPESDDVRAFILPTLALSAQLLGEFSEASRLYQNTIKLSAQSGNQLSLVGTMANLAVTHLAQGKLSEAIRIAREAVEKGMIQGVALPVSGWPKFPLAEGLYEQNRLLEAENILTEGLRLVRQGQLTDYFGQMPALLSRILLAQERIEDAETAITAALDSAGRTTVLRYISEVETDQVILWLKQGKIEQALAWAGQFQSRPANEILQEVEQICLAEVFIASKRLEEAIELLLKLGEGARANNRFGREIAIQTKLATACWLAGDMQGSRQNIERALSLGEPEGYLRPFLNCGQPMADMLRWLERDRDSGQIRKMYAAYLDRLANAFRNGTPHANLAVKPNNPLTEPLTPREMDVLRLLAEGLSNREIAGRLFVSPNTLRVYTTNLYAKLDVHARAQAVKRAQELGLI